MKTILTITGLAIALMTSPSMANNRKDEAKAQKRFDKKFHELTQPLQYDGEYSPPGGRTAEPEATSTTPVRFVPAWKRQIPVIVKPAPRYVDPVPPQGGQNGSQAQQTPTQGFQQQPNVALTSTNLPAPDQADPSTPGAISGSGSATGSTAYPNYAGGLPVPGAGGAPVETTTTTISTTATSANGTGR